MKNFTVLFIAFVLCSFGTQAQKVVSRQVVDSILVATNQFFKGQVFSYDLKYESTLAGENSIRDRDSGKFARNRNKMYSNTPSGLIVQDDQLRIVVDESNGEIIVLDPDYKFENDFVLMDFEEMMAEVEKILWNNATETKTLTLLMKPKHRLSKQEVFFDQRGIAQGVKLYYSEEVEFEENEQVKKGKPVVSIKLLNITQNVVWQPQMEVSHYVKMNKTAFVGMGKYSAFEIVDYRLLKN